MSYKRDLYGTAVSAGLVTRDGDGSVYYDTNVVCNITYDNGVTQNGAHGRFAKFSDTRNRTIVKKTADYNLSLVRASITTNEIPLYTARPSALITENGVPMWECTAQPGLYITWTGPVFATTTTTVGPTTVQMQTYVAWPNYGWLPWYTVQTVQDGTGLLKNFASGAIDLGAIGASTEVNYLRFATRLQNAINTATGVSLLLTAPTPGSTAIQQYSLQNFSTSLSLYFDFTLPIGTTQGKTPLASKEGILQAAKVLGFIPNQVFAFPASTTTLFPRAFQMPWRSTMNMYSYKTARWVPEDTGATIPSASEIASNQFSTYFDCYSYEHVLEQVINPAFQRCIWDEFDSGDVFESQCLTRQLQKYCNANCVAVKGWASSTSYAVGDSIIYNGQAFIALRANNSANPVLNPDKWQSCGQSINNSFSPDVKYKTNDAVTFSYYSSPDWTTGIYELTSTQTGAPVPGANGNGWTFFDFFVSIKGSSGATTTPMVASIGTLAPYITFSSATNLFTLNLDSYGFGGTTYANVDDGYFGTIDDPGNTTHQTLNSSLNDIARDSWGLTGTNGSTAPSYIVARRPFVSFDERANVEVDDYFHILFGNWPGLRLEYFDPFTQLTTSYVRYIFQAANAGLGVRTPLPLTSTSPGTTGLSATYLPYGRVGGTVPYIYTFPQDHPSIGLSWNPVDAIIVATGNVPIEPDLTTPPYFIDDFGQVQTLASPGNFLKILAELPIQPVASQQIGQQYQSEIVFHPVTPVVMDLQAGREFNQFDFQLFYRVKETQTYRPVSLSRGGSANLRWVFQRK